MQQQLDSALINELLQNDIHLFTNQIIALVENKKDAAVEASFLDYRSLPNTSTDSAASATNTTGIEYVSFLPYHEHQVHYGEWAYWIK